MSERSLIFPRGEFARRCTALQYAMQASGFDALLLTSPADVFYTTGFLTRFWESPARPWFVVIPLSGDPVAVIPAIGADLMGRTWIDDIRTWPAPDPRDDGVSLLGHTLRGIVPKGGAIGLPMGLETSLRMPVADYDLLRARCAPRRFGDATRVIQSVREIKSEVEVEKIRAACGIADRAFARVPDFAGAGVPVDRVFRDFQMALLSEGADWVSYVAGGAGQGGYGDVISPAPSAPLKPGDVLMLDTGAVRDGYFCDFDRNWSIGPASEDAKRAHRALYIATEEVLNTLRPGMHAHDVHRILADTLRRQGVTPGGGRLGHGLGITLTEWPSFTPHDTTELRAGMVLTLEPGVEIEPSRIIVHEENIVLRETGPELLCQRTPSELPEIAI